MKGNTMGKEDSLNALLDGLHVLSLALLGAADPNIELSEEAKLALAGYAGKLQLKAQALAQAESA